MAFNYGGSGTGAVGGALTGASLGSLGGPLGTAIGAGLGGLTGLLSGGFTGSKGKFKQTPNRFNPQQQQSINFLTSQGQQRLQNPLEGFGDVENYANQQFQSNIVPTLAERFSQLGGEGTARSGNFQGALGAAGAGLASHLAALRHQYGLENQQSGLQLLQLGLEPQFENYYEAAQPGIGPQFLSAGANIAGNYFGNQLFNQQSDNNTVNVDKNKLMQILNYLQQRS